MRLPTRLMRAVMLIMAIAALAELSLCVEGSITVCKCATLLGSEAAYFVAGIIIYSLWSGGFGLRLIASLALTASSVVMLKTLLKMPRPPSSLWLASASGPGFPSGHTALTTAFWLLITLYTRSPIIAGIGLFHSVAVAYSRVALHVHYTIDVVGAAILAVALNSILYAFWRRIDSVSYMLTLSAASLSASVVAVAVMPSYESAWKLAGISLGLLAAASILRPLRNSVVAGLENSDNYVKPRLFALLYALAWLLFLAYAPRNSHVATLLAYALFAFNTVMSRPFALLALCRRGLRRASCV